MGLIKRTFYPDPEVEEVLASASPKKVSEKVNQLILKGLMQEKEDEIAAEYEKYDQALSQNASAHKKELQTNLLFSNNLFSGEDETKDWY